jgi:hypothetical protein
LKCWISPAEIDALPLGRRAFDRIGPAPPEMRDSVKLV